MKHLIFLIVLPICCMSYGQIYYGLEADPNFDTLYFTEYNFDTGSKNRLSTDSIDHYGIVGFLDFSQAYVGVCGGVLYQGYDVNIGSQAIINFETSPYSVSTTPLLNTNTSLSWEYLPGLNKVVSWMGYFATIDLSNGNVDSLYSLSTNNIGAGFDMDRIAHNHSTNQTYLLDRYWDKIYTYDHSINSLDTLKNNVLFDINIDSFPVNYGVMFTYDQDFNSIVSLGDIRRSDGTLSTGINKMNVSTLDNENIFDMNDFPTIFANVDFSNNSFYYDEENKSIVIGIQKTSLNKTVFYRFDALNGIFVDSTSFSGYNINLTSTSCTSLHVESSNTNLVNIFPNPSSSIIYLQGEVSSHKYKIYNIQGSLVEQGNCTSSIEIQQLNNGLYLLEVDSDRRVKFVKN